MEADEALARLRALGFAEDDAQRLWAHFADAEARGKQSHGFSRVEWLETRGARPVGASRTLLVERGPGFQRWHGGGAIGYLVLEAVVRAQLAASAGGGARSSSASGRSRPGCSAPACAGSPTAASSRALTATSPPRLGHPDGGPKLTGTKPLAIGIPSSGGDPLVTDVSMGRVTLGDVLAGLAQEDELVPFGGEQAHKAFALALGLQLLVDALVRDEGHGAVLLVARPEADPVPALRELAAGHSAARAIPSNSLLLASTRLGWTSPATQRRGPAAAPSNSLLLGWPWPVRARCPGSASSGSGGRRGSRRSPRPSARPCGTARARRRRW